ncbi:MAG: hypothetical protein U0795_26850 [Pirellulales bacterium]
MTTDVFRYSFGEHVPLEEAEATLVLSTFAVEGLCGVARVRMDLTYHVDDDRRVIWVDGSNRVGTWVVQVFTNLLVREFGEESFQVRRVADGSAPHTDGRAS